MTCASKTEADKIALVLLQKHLIACGKQVAVGSDFLWKENVDHNDEILLIMDSREDLFDQIETEIKKIHSYETFVLQAVPVTRLSKDAEAWMQSGLLT